MTGAVIHGTINLGEPAKVKCHTCPKRWEFPDGVPVAAVLLALNLHYARAHDAVAPLVVAFT